MPCLLYTSRLLVVRTPRLFNVKVLTAKLIPTLTKKVKSLITLRPQSPKDYFSVGRYWVYKKLLLTLVLVACAGVFIYFTMFASPLPATPAQPEQVLTTVTFEMCIRDRCTPAPWTARPSSTVPM